MPMRIICAVCVSIRIHFMGILKYFKPSEFGLLENIFFTFRVI